MNFKTNCTISLSRQWANKLYETFLIFLLVPRKSISKSVNRKICGCSYTTGHHKKPQYFGALISNEHSGKVSLKSVNPTCPINSFELQRRKVKPCVKINFDLTFWLPKKFTVFTPHFNGWLQLFNNNSCVTLHYSPATTILNENPVWGCEQVNWDLWIFVL